VGVLRKNISTYIHMLVGRMVLHTYIMLWFKESQNYNVISPCNDLFSKLSKF
jgi:hypothetical protein